VTILSRQFLASYLGLYVAILFVSTLVIAVIEMMLNFDDALDFQQGPAGVAAYLFLRVPSYYLPYLVPVASFAAAFLCLGLPARAREILALKAGGIAPQRVCVPVLAAAAALSAAALLLNETIVRDTSSEFNRRETRAETSDLFQARGGFWYQRGPLFFHVQEADREDRSLFGVTVYERDANGRLIRSIDAATAHIADDHRWHLRDATVRRFPADPAAAPEVHHAPEMVLDMASEQDLSLLDADAESLSLFGLSEYIDAVVREGRNPVRYRALFHARLADPLSVLVFALLAAPLGLAVERSRSLAGAAVKGIALIAVFYTLQTSAVLFATGGIAAAVLGPWFVLAAFGLYGTWQYARA
jgi:lipopolysaccharide export system permease protein